MMDGFVWLFTSFETAIIHVSSATLLRNISELIFNQCSRGFLLANDESCNPHKGDYGDVMRMYFRDLEQIYIYFHTLFIYPLIFKQSITDTIAIF